MDPKGIGYDNLDFIQLAQDRIYKLDLRNTTAETFSFYKINLLGGSEQCCQDTPTG